MNSLEKNLRPIPRTWDEATRNATYATPIQTFKSDVQETFEFIGGMLYGGLIVSIVASAFGSLLYFLFGG
jgi:hypothetical protein